MSLVISHLSLVIFGYLFGSIPWGYLISKAKGIDIRKVGSGNIGGTNVIRALGIKWGLLVAVLDVLKGVIPVYLALNFLVFDWQIASVAITPVLGHIFPVWLGFRGGKGVATTLGVIFILLDWKILLPLLLVWLLVLAISQISSFSNLLMVSFLPLAFWV
ncbi:MAG: acyl-phosphate glycerol 3-phosphate acyltransferase, partial [Candidatus Nealsonbacteria bacterium CG10_big_fil_rev_8_21_14_0_10_37_25]